jgi:fucose permease
MRGFHELAWLTIAGGFTFGMLLSLMAGSRRTLVEWLRLEPEQAGGLLSVLSLTLIPGSITAGLLVDLCGGKWIIALGSLLACISLLLLLSSTHQSYGRCLSAIIVAGLGASCLNVGSAVLMPRAFFDDNPVAATNLGFVFVGLGALVTPVVADLLLQIQRTGYRKTLAVFALACLVPLGLAVIAPGEPMPANGGGVHFEVFQRPSLWLAGGVFILYAPLEAWLSASALPYLRRIGFRETGAAVLLALTWLAFLGSRLVIAYWEQTESLDPDSTHLVMLLLALIATVALGNMAGASRHDSVTLWILLVGVCLGPIYSSLVGFLFLNFDPKVYGSAYGTVYAIGTAGGMLLTPLFRPSEQKVAPDKSVLWMLAGISLSLIGMILAAWVSRAE